MRKERRETDEVGSETWFLNQLELDFHSTRLSFTLGPSPTNPDLTDQRESATTHPVFNLHSVGIRERSPIDGKLCSLPEGEEPDDGSHDGSCDNVCYDGPVEKDEERVVVGGLEDGRDGEEGGEEEEDSERETGCDRAGEREEGQSWG